MVRMHPWGGAGMLAGLIASVLFVVVVAAIIAGVVALVRHSRRPVATSLPRQEVAGEDPLRIVQQRYAKGEITREEYMAIREDLKT